MWDPPSVPLPFSNVCFRLVNTHIFGTNPSSSKADKDGEVPTADTDATGNEVDDGEVKSNGGDDLLVTVLCRLHISGCRGLSRNHCGGGGGLQGGRGQDGPDRKALLHISPA